MLYTCTYIYEAKNIWNERYAGFHKLTLYSSNYKSKRGKPRCRTASFAVALMSFIVTRQIP